MYHLLSDWSQCKVTGYPFWKVHDDDLELVLNEEPVHVAIDACRIDYNKLQYQGSITGRIIYSAAVDSIMFLSVDYRQEDLSAHAYKQLPNRALYVMLIDPRRQSVSVSDVYEFRTHVRPTRHLVWRVGWKGLNRAGSIQRKGPEEEQGFCSPRAALTCSVSLLRATKGCYSISSWLKSKLDMQDNPQDTLGTQAVREYLSLHESLERVMTVQKAEGHLSAASDIHRRKYYWAWVYKTLKHGAEAMYSTRWRFPEHMVLSSKLIKKCVCSSQRHAFFRVGVQDVPDLIGDQSMWYVASEIYPVLPTYHLVDDLMTPIITETIQE